jgi:nucleotide-binding universal stress UspA family protein
MFKHILLPTDGSPISESAVQQCIKFAQGLGARVSAVHVVPEFQAFTYKPEMLEESQERYMEDAEAHARQYLDVVSKAALEANVPCDTACLASDHPYEAIIAAAQEKGCDLIAMATHGRTGMKALLLGSETQKVLTHTRIPVLVYH